MSCRFYNFLYRLLPFTAWHVLLIRRHFAHCPDCSREFEIDEELKEITIKPEQVPAAPDLWAAVRRQLTQQSQGMTDRFRRWLKLFDVTFLIFIVIMLVLFFFLIVYFKFLEK